MKKHFTEIQIFTKPHIAHYLIHHFGKPCAIPSGNFITEFLRVNLSKPLKRNDSRINALNTPVLILLSQDDINRYGYDLTKTAELNFSNSVDNYIRSQIRSIAENILNNNSINEDWKRRYLELHKEHKALIQLIKENLSEKTLKKNRAFDIKLNKRVSEYEQYKVKLNDALMMAAYDCLGFNEQILPFETIRKDFYRYKKRQNA